MDKNDPEDQHARSFFLSILLFFAVGTLFGLLGFTSSHGEKIFAFIFGFVIFFSLTGALADFFLSQNRYSLGFFFLVGIPLFLFGFTHSSDSTLGISVLITVIFLILILAGGIVFFVRYYPLFRDYPRIQKEGIITRWGKGTLPYSRYLSVSVERYIFMSVITLGNYQAYWSYKNWEYLKNRDNLRIHPFWRGLFDIFFIHDLLRKIRADPLLNEKKPARFDWSTLGWVYVAMYVALGVLSFRFQISTGAPSPSYFVVLMVLFFAIKIYCLIPVQRYVTETNELIDPSGEYYPWSAGHYIVIGLTVFYTVLLHFIHVK